MNVKKESGSALVMALILCAITAISLVAYVSTTRTGLRLEYAKSKKKTLENEAGGGINIAKAELLQIGRDQNFSTLENAQEEGLVYDVGQPTLARFKEEPGCTICRNVWYYPSSKNSAVDNEFPKAFTVVSVAENKSTGQIHTIESMVVLRKESYGEFAYAILDPDAPTRGTTYNYRPHTGIEYNGRVHYGNMVPLLTKGDASSQKHEFMGPVTFALTPAPGHTYPFDMENHAWVQATFKKGYQDGVDLGDFTSSAYRDSIFDGVKNQKTDGIFTAFPAEDLCLKFSDTVINRYRCESVNRDTVSPLDLYQGERAGNPPIETYTIPPNGVVLYWNQSIHVKGVLDGKVTVVTEQNLVPDGDIQFKDQKDSSDDRFGAVARQDILVHHSVPLGNGSYGKSDRTAGNYDPGLWNAYENNVNFIVASDRDSLDVTKGGNQLSRLDLDGVYFSLNGSFRIDNINDWVNSAEGLVIPGTDGVKYSTKSTDLNYFYIDADANGIPDGRKANPMYCINCCFSWSPACPAFNPAALIETPKALGQNLKLYGGLLMKNYSDMSVARFYSGIGWQHTGFYGFEVSNQPTLGLSPPPGFPSSSNLVINTIYTKAYNTRFTPGS